MNITELQEMWAADVKIDETQLGREALKAPHLHCKYLDILVNSKLRLSAYRHDLAKEQLLKMRYWKGELTKEELEENKLPQWQYNKPLKSELESMLDADDKCIKIKTKIEYLELMVYQLESIMGAIKGRSWEIKTAVEFAKFQAGL